MLHNRSQFSFNLFFFPLRQGLHLEFNNVCSPSLCSDVSIVPVSKRGCVVPQDVLSHIRRTTCLITVILANNETGVIMPVEESGR
jgi:cysteine sulfinate desulfinase/cysteine desulfurase-like protein